MAAAENKEKHTLSVIRKKIVILSFFGIFFMPFFLKYLSAFTGIRFDMPLNGYYDTVEKPAFQTADFLQGEYQRLAEAWTKANYKPAGMMTRIYNTVQYDLFYLGNRIVGRNHDIFETAYIDAQLCLNEANNYSLASNAAALREYVRNMEEVQQKLEQCGKHLFVYVTPSKAEFHLDNIPDKYIRMQPENAVRAVDLFRELIADTGIPCFFCTDIKEELQYPAFYTTGIHWSRTYEQISDQYIINCLAEITGKHYPDFRIGNVKESKVPFGRDADVYSLLNTMHSSGRETYYEYEVQPLVSDQDSRMKILLQGGSFAEGLLGDITSNFPEEELYYINYNNYMRKGGEMIPIENKDWNNLELNNYLDLVDLVVVELNEAVVHSYSNGFIDYLNHVLDTYVPNDSAAAGSREEGNSSTLQGLGSEEDM